MKILVEEPFSEKKQHLGHPRKNRNEQPFLFNNVNPKFHILLLNNPGKD